MEKLKIFCRIRPTPRTEKMLPFIVDSSDTIVLQTNRAKLSSSKEQQVFSFSHVFQQNSSQEEIFEALAKPVIDNCLGGYNGTIFAYGQTGSGKTFTMSGGDEWKQRGIIPRVLSYIFQQFNKLRSKCSYQLSVSYIEIYNQNAYDLLEERNHHSNFQEWPKITFIEDQENFFCPRSGTLKTCKTEEEVLDYFMMGNYLRKVSCTNMNQASSRSHCIFILNVKGTDKQTSTQIYSKINLVDLAGSERVSKSQAEGIVLTEAKSINLSLSYLEQVIVSLNQRLKGKSKGHIPYRNSLLTTLLKNSLGGNCKTVMIATISSEANNLQQTISTLRFSQRVRQIKNQTSKNQKNSLQTKLEILERQNMFLRKKIQNLSQSNFQRTDSEQIANKNQITSSQLANKNQITSSQLASKNQITSSQLASKNPRLSQKQITKKIQDYINNKTDFVQIESMDEAHHYFKKIKEIYQNKMIEYSGQLQIISKKIIDYELLLDKRQKQCRFNLNF